MRTTEVFVKTGNTLKAEDLQGKRVPVTIESYAVKKFDDGTKIVLRFEGKEKCLMLNLTNADTIEQLLGTNEMDEWIGQRIVLKPARTKFQGKMVDCIRIDDSQSAATPPPVRRPPPPQPSRRPEPPPREPGADEEQPWEASDSGIPF